MLKWNGEIIAQNHFPDGTLHLSVQMPLYMLGIGDTITWKYESDAELFSLICLVKHIHRHYPDLSLSLCMHYLPHARMDRVKDGRMAYEYTLSDLRDNLHGGNFDGTF